MTSPSINDKSIGSPSISGGERAVRINPWVRRGNPLMKTVTGKHCRREPADQSGVAAIGVTSDFLRGYTLDEFMKKLNARHLQQVQKLCQKYEINVPDLSSRECKYRFQFRNELPDKLFTDTNFIEDNIKIEIALVDASNNVICSGPMATAEIEIVVLKGDIDGDENGEWTEEEFKNYVLEPRQGYQNDCPPSKKLVECKINNVQECYYSENCPEMSRDMIGMKGNWEKTYDHASKSWEWSDIPLDGCLDNPHAPDENFYELTRSSSSQTSNVLVQPNGMFTCSQGLAPPISLESGNNLKKNFMTPEGIWSDTNWLDMHFEDLQEENDRSYLPNNFYIGSPLLLFVANG
ncbi:hypothetical protein M5K25_013823 [Dendrobium thyrsiflorum]|uniref:Calmodulin binding protein-like N-terminal domain-containing protein n=1 Tax=Dendrobium thyrsiflorum TaxID=117978 RepID=A0ABD0UUB5_DENTH